ncbi:hydantoin racemase family protein [Schizosaccharomyces japonicus yFS275]|uniref:Hydantoin racemase family protein n=1 Tax=Schizosaccharomyces japonicus (strain yFS275 / FY16936) TaxID=402676 RepID=B6JUU2_SCHJY|nr:hydantoin racemase family protein [Schizosaccharomyces japonicus yFS275]EEB05044.2 hydantoin racemase family protein [Schizosaccharomyces japonicus yFS275]
MKTILVINPNCTESMTNCMRDTLSKCSPADTVIDYYTCPPEGPASIESVTDAIRSANVVMSNLPEPKELERKYSAFLVACYSDHPLVHSLRECVHQPVLGIMQASILTALSVGHRIGIVTTTKRYDNLLTDGVRAMGIDNTVFVGVETTGLTPLELESKSREVVEESLAQCAKRLVQDGGADVVCLGCAGMANMGDIVRKAVGDNVSVIDGVIAGVHLLWALVQMKVQTSKQGVYQSLRVNPFSRI